MLAWIRLMRPWNALIAAAAVWLGWVSLSAPPGVAVAAWGSLSMFLLVAAGNAQNDILDRAADRVNRPDRPLAAGSLPVSAAGSFAIAAYLAGVAAGWAASPTHGALAAGMALLLLAYNGMLKGMPLLGNLAVSLLCALAVYFPEFPEWPVHTIPALTFAFIATLARELVKDAEDIEGDRAAGLRTLAVIAGPEAARRIAFALLMLLLVLLPWPMLAFGHRWPYALGVMVLAGPFLVLLTGELSRPGADLTRCQKLLKGLMAGGMIALFAGVVGR